jgi:hypothetical protein
MKCTSLAATLFAVAPLACSSGNASHANTASDGGQATLAGHDMNPEGVAYPSPAPGSSYGRTRRSGSTAGSVIKNFKFHGYPNGDASQGLQTIALADYYDPCNKRYKLLHLTVAAAWCAPCNQETDAIVAAKPQLDSDHIAVLQALDDGPMEGVGATQGDLDHWTTLHKTNFTEMLDPALANLSGFFNPAAVPWNCDIDPRTMEILNDSTGAEIDVTLGLSSIPANPGYTVAVTCN